MAQIIPRISATHVISNLDTYNHTAETTGPYTAECQLLEIPPSGIVIAIKQNGSTLLSSAVPADSQQAINLRLQLNCAINDLISVQVSSSVPSDTALNAFKAILNIRQGNV